MPVSEPLELLLEPDAPELEVLEPLPLELLELPPAVTHVSGLDRSLMVAREALSYFD